MATLRQYLAEANVPTTLPGIDFRPLQSAGLIGKEMEKAGEKVHAEAKSFMEREQAIEKEKRKASLAANALDRFATFSKAVDDMESEVKQGGLTSDQYMPGWIMQYQKLKREHMKGITDPEEMGLVLKHIAPFEVQHYGQARNHSDMLWGSELQAKTENGLQYLEEQARKKGDAGLSVDSIQEDFEQGENNITLAGAAYTPEKSAEAKRKSKERILKSYIQSRVVTDPGLFMQDHTTGKNEKLRSLMHTEDYWSALSQAYTLADRNQAQLKEAYKQVSEDLSKKLRLKIINGEDVSPAALKELGPFMTDSDIGNIDSLRRTYEEYHGRDVITDRAVYDDLNSRIMRDEMVDEKALIPYSKKLSKTDLSHLYSTIMARQSEREQENKPRNRLVKAGRSYISRIFAASNVDLDYDRVVNQVAAEALVLYDEKMARDTKGEQDPMDVAKDVTQQFAPTVNGRIKYGAGHLQPVLRYNSVQEIQDAYAREEIDRPTKNSQLRILNRMKVLAAMLEEEKESEKKAKAKGKK